MSTHDQYPPTGWDGPGAPVPPAHLPPAAAQPGPGQPAQGSPAPTQPGHVPPAPAQPGHIPPAHVPPGHVPPPHRRGPGRMILVGVAALALGAGSVLPAIGYQQARPDGQPLEERGTAEVSAVEVDVSRGTVEVVPADGDEVTWSVVGGSATTVVEVVESADGLSIDVGDARSRYGFGLSWDVDGFGWLDGGRSHPLITLALPAGTDLSVDTDFGDVRSDVTQLGALDVTSSFGDVRLSGSAESVELSLDFGDVRADGLVVPGDVFVTTDMGQVELRMPETPASVDASSEFGDVHLALPPGPYEIVTNAEMGSVSNTLVITDDSPRVRVSARTSFGDVHLETS